MSVLLVDDDGLVRLTLGALLEDEGLDVVEAGSLKEARERLADGGAFELVVLDHSLADGAGSELLGELRALTPAPRVAMLTGLDVIGGVTVDVQIKKSTAPEEMVRKLVALTVTKH